MDKLVYLFELDSRRGTAEEWALGQQALFEELVRNGNTVVVTFNQLTDSEAFLCPLHDRAAWESLMELVRMGAIRVSRYGALRTASQYIQNSIEKCLGADSDAFLFSGIPVRCTERELLGELRDALRYSDPARLTERLAAVEAARAAAPAEQQARLEAEAARLTYLNRYLELIFTLSREPLSCNPPRQDGPRAFLDFYRRILAFCQTEAASCGAEIAALLPGAVARLETVRADLAERERAEGKSLLHNRTNWVNALDALAECPEACLAEGLIDLCYNYTLEESIRGVSKHYDDALASGEGSFSADLRQRLTAYWGQYRSGVHRFRCGDSDALPAAWQVALPRWNTAVRLLRGHTAAPVAAEGSAPLYEEGFLRDRRRWGWRLAAAIGRQLAFALVYVVLFVAVSLGMGYLEDAFTSLASAHLWAVLSLVAGVILFGILGAVLERLLHMPDILESIKNIGVGCLDLWGLLTAPKDRAYRNRTV